MACEELYIELKFCWSSFAPRHLFDLFISLPPYFNLSTLAMSTTTVTRTATESHSYIEPSGTDHRSPCPALNALANHGYLYAFKLS